MAPAAIVGNSQSLQRMQQSPRSQGLLLLSQLQGKRGKLLVQCYLIKCLALLLPKPAEQMQPQEARF